jgi:hypothetical protein
MLETQDEKETLNSEQQSPQSTAIFLHASRLCVSDYFMNFKSGG